jgi:aminodeoxychorismate synthase component I
MPTAPHARYTPLPTAIHTLVESTPNAILLETSRFDAHNHHSYLFLSPTRILTAHTLDQIPALFAQIEAALTEGLHLAGYLSYECNAAFDPATARVPTSTSRMPQSSAAPSRISGEARTPDSTTLPLAHLAAYPAPIVFDHATGNFLTPAPQANPVILSEARSAQPKDPEALDHPTTLSLDPTSNPSLTPAPQANSVILSEARSAQPKDPETLDYPTTVTLDPTSNLFLTPAPQANFVILSEARSAQPKAPEALDHATTVSLDLTSNLFLTPAPQANPVILSEARSAQPKDPETLGRATTPRQFQPASPTPTAPILTNPTLRISDDAYTAAIEKIQAYIAAGDTYQVNFTDAIEFPTNQSPASLFTTLAQNQSVAYAAFLNLGLHQILSLSPELFFRVGTDNKITTRPMKGTMPRGLDITEDAAVALALQRDEKNRAEHVMIVDLLRNDLGRIALPGSVAVDELFAVERYQTLHQMTSTISATLPGGLPFYDLFRALFPCGSITGAPKIRTMQIIRELEAHPRGIYTGAIGHIAPDRSATFSVAIRTLVLQNGQATMGVGGGIVADSIAEDEHREALLKASFLTRIHQPFELIETLLYDQHYPRLPLHLDRLESSAHYFDFLCDRTAVEAQLRAFAAFLDPRHPHRVRLLLAPTGTISLTSQPLANSPQRPCFSFCHSHLESAVISPRHESTAFRVPHPYAASPWMGGEAKPSDDTLGVPHPDAPFRTGGNDAASQPTQPSPSAQDLTITLSPHRTNSTDPFLRHKTTNRHLYNDELTRARADGFDEVLFLNERSELTEGAISNLFVELPAYPGRAGKFLTPPLTAGVLPGILRRHLLETQPDLEERTLTLADLQPPNTLWLGNSLRGLRKAKLLLLDR